MRLTALLVISLLACGCSTRRQVAIGAGVGLGIMVVGGGIAATDPARDQEVVYPGSPQSLVAGAVGLTGALILLGALLFLPEIGGRNQAVRAAEEQRERAQAASDLRSRRQERVWQLYKAAEVASRADDCATVRELDAETRALDLDFHVKVFIRDVGIKRCLAPAPAAAPR